MKTILKLLDAGLMVLLLSVALTIATVAEIAEDTEGRPGR